MTYAKQAVLAVVISLVAVGVILVTCPGCGGGDDGGAAQTARLSVAITDASGPFAEVHLSVVAVRVVRLGSGSAPTGPGLPLIASFSPARQVSVLDLAYQQEILGTASVPVGTYEQVRLVVAPNVSGQPPANYVTLLSDPTTKLPLDTPSGETAGLKVLGRFEVQPGVANAIVLDFDPSRAIVTAGQSGKYLFKPTGIRIVDVSQTLPNYGSLSLTVDPASAWPDAMVYVTPMGSSVPIAAGTVNTSDGSFRAFLPSGQYSVSITASGFQTYNTALLAPPIYYPVAIGADTPVGTVTLAAP
ncbi:MAG: DUF4382 domain-containing protein [Armatimonadetes bacterium]|nr:DUF4382 domain-containing protein [Armatimonadota bacterium]